MSTLAHATNRRATMPALPACPHPRTGRRRVSYRSPATARRAALVLSGGRLPDFTACRFYICACPRCGHERPRRFAGKGPPVVEHLTGAVLERDGYQCRRLVTGAECCPATSDLVVHHLDDG